MIAKANGFVYNIESKHFIAEFEAGNDIYTLRGVFYGSKQEAIEFGIIFNTEIEPQEEEKKD
jgi:hypothetical protein